MGVSVAQHRLLLLRHGETEWSRSGQHTGRTDLDLTDRGRQRARMTVEALYDLDLDNPLVVSSPRRRALVTAELAGLTVNEVSELLAEWDYGAYEGLTTPQIRETVPDWLVWTHGCEAAGGESVEQVSDRADRAIEFALERMQSRDVIFVGHAHFSRSVITRWVELPLPDGVRFAMSPASIAVCGFERDTRQLIALGLTGYQDPAKPR